MSILNMQGPDSMITTMGELLILGLLNLCLMSFKGEIKILGDAKEENSVKWFQGGDEVNAPKRSTLKEYHIAGIVVHYHWA